MRVLLITLFSLLFGSAILNAQETEDKDEKNWTADVRASAKDIELFAGDASTKPLQMISAYQWSNPARQIKGNRSLLLYLDQGRPVASCKVYPNGDALVHTFISMTNKPLEGREKNGNIVWSPIQKKIAFQRLDDVGAPRKSAALRAIQMKKIAGEFSAMTGEGEAKRQKAGRNLRLLPTPLYHYPKGQSYPEGVVDGAVFCFVVQGGNPQILMTIEAIQEKEEAYWRTSFSRRTFAELSVTRNQKRVWNADYIPPRDLRDLRSTFFKLVIPARDAQDTTSETKDSSANPEFAIR